MRARLFLFLLFSSVLSLALEISLEENKAERGSVAYVDMKQLFKKSPETQKAKKAFEEEIRKAQEEIAYKKADILSLRAEVSSLKLKREFLIKNLTPTPPSLEPNVSLSSVSIPGVAAPALSAPMPSSSTEPLTSPTVQIPREPVPAGSTNQMEARMDSGPTSISTAGVVQTAILAPQLNEMDAQIASKTKELENMESEFAAYQAQTEKNLLETESRKTEILLSKIYRLVQEVAREEGFSVVVDKTQILFGHGAMDLTPKVLKRLKT